MLLSSLRTSLAKSDNRAVGVTLQRPSSLSFSSPSFFRPKPASENGTNSKDQHEPELQDLNNSLLALAEIFPDIRTDVFREMLGSLSQESRLHIVTDHLLNAGAAWIKGRWRISSEIPGAHVLSDALDAEAKETTDAQELVPVAERFRSSIYKTAVKTALEDEFKTLSRTTIEGVLAEQNFSYTLCRPVLIGLAAKSWRITLKALMKWRRTTQPHFMLVHLKTLDGDGLRSLQLKKTASPELDDELYQTILRPILEKETRSKDAISHELAILLNNADAKDNSAVYECECCYDEVAFESMAVCSTGEHILCFSCVRNTVSAALFAQAWSKTVDQDRAAIRCFSSSSETCKGCIPNYLTERALLQSRGGSKTWLKMEEKLALVARQATATTYHECPFCIYAEDQDVYWPKGSLAFRRKGFERVSDIGFLCTILLFSILLCWHYFWVSFFLPIPPLQSLFHNSLNTLARRRRLGHKFSCKNPSCSRSSCRLCKAAWRDPHKCNDKEEVSLRTSIEAAKSAASKRVCPKCNLSFVKESGCNKMTCTCGYTMCYLCRQGLGQSSANRNNPHDDHDYSHFCSHFRAFPGRCMQCDKCDLYREGNQEEIVRRAGEAAEKEWHANQKSRAVSGSESGVKKGGEEDDKHRTRAKLQALMDRLVDTFITC